MITLCHRFLYLFLHLTSDDYKFINVTVVDEEGL